MRHLKYKDCECSIIKVYLFLFTLHFSPVLSHSLHSVLYKNNTGLGNDKSNFVQEVVNNMNQKGV